MIDSFRHLHPSKEKFTRSSTLVNSRIDYIWVSKELGKGLIYCDIIEADTITGSNHSIVVATVITGIMKKSRFTAYNKRLKGKQQVFQLDKAKEENWENYKAKLDRILEKKLPAQRKFEHSQEIETQDKDVLQDLIATSIISCAKATLPRKKISIGDIQTIKLRDSKKTKKDLKKIRSISQLCAKKLDLQISDLERESSNTIITDINYIYRTEIEEITEETWTRAKL